MKRISVLLFALVCPSSAHAFGLIVPDLTEEGTPKCVSTTEQTLTVDADPGGATAIFTSRVNVDAEGLAAELWIPETQGIAPQASWDGAPVSLRRLDVNEAHTHAVETALGRATPALLAAAGRPMWTGRIEATSGAHELIVSGASSVDWQSAVPSLVHTLRNFGTACYAPAQRVLATIRSDVPIGAVFSPYHDRTLSRPSPTEAIVELSVAAGQPANDLHLYLTRGEDEVAASILTYRDRACGRGESERGHMLFAAGPTVTEVEEGVAKDIAFVIDTSGSMSGEKITQVRQAMLDILDNLGPDDRYDLITFADNATSHFGGLASASDPVRLSAAKDVARQLPADGSTNINAALLMALAELSSSERPALIVFLTDGEATEGVTASDEILANVAAANTGGVKVFSFGVGDNVNTTLLDGLARQTAASVHYVRPGQDIQPVLAGFYGEIQAPVATNPSIDTGGFSLTEAFPVQLPDLFVGTNAFSLSRFSHSDVAAISLSADTVAGRRQYSVSGAMVELGTQHAFLPRLWASRLLGELLFEARQNDGDQATVDAIRELSRRYGFVTRWTPYSVDSNGNVDREYMNPTGDEVGSDAVGTSAGINDISGNDNAGNYSADSSVPVRQVLDRTLARFHGYWTDSRAPTELEGVEMIDVRFGSADWRRLAAATTELKEILSVGRSVIFEWQCELIRVSDPAEHEDPVPSPDVVPEHLFEALPGAETPIGNDIVRPSDSLDIAEPSCACSASGPARSPGAEVFLGLLLVGVLSRGRRRSGRGSKVRSPF